MKKTFLFMFIISSLLTFAQEDLVWKNILIEDFNNNDKRWYIGLDKLRESKISNGVLTDWFGKSGFVQANTISVNVNSGKDYLISFSISNLHGDADKKYRVYKENTDGALIEEWNNYPIWGFVWGYKDWDNYNCILFQHVNYYTYVNIIYKKNGKETVVLDWTPFEYWGKQQIEINIEQFGGNSVRVYSGNGVIIYSYTGGVFQWYGNKIGPYIGNGAKVELGHIYIKERKPHENTNYNEYSLKSYWELNGADMIEGIYENVIKTDDMPKYRLALKRSVVGYSLIYLSGATNSIWKTGDIKAYLTPTATPNIFKAIWFMENKTPQDNLYIAFESGSMKIIWTDRKENFYIKLYPTSNDNIRINRGHGLSTGTGFALTTNGYIVTNHHIVNGANTIIVKGVNGDFSKSYKARLIVADPNNDLAIIQINDASFSSLGTPPYSIKTTQADVGSDIFVLGYPLTATMGDEVKLTNGIISARSGFQGDITSYQISAPIQPGSSGAPLFDKNGYLIGVVNAKHIGAENAGYAVKVSYLKILAESTSPIVRLPSNNILVGKPLTEQVKIIKKYVYIIEVN